MSSNQSQYHNEFAALVKITLRDGDATASEKEFLANLSSKLEMPKAEYQEILQNYLSYPLEPIATHSKQLEALYTLTKLVSEDATISEENQKVWLERMGKGMGFMPANIPYIVNKSLTMIKEGANLETFKEGINNINQ